MQIVSIEPLPRSKKRKRITLDTRESFVLYAGEIRRMPGLRVGEDLSEESFESIKTSILLPRAKKRCLHLLEKQDRTRADLYGRLTSSGYPEDIADAAIDYASSYGYVDDRRYASNYIYFHQEQKSRRRLTQDLLRKGIDKDIIEDCLDEASLTSEEEKIRELIEKRHYDVSSADPRDKAKMIRFLLGRGFDYDKVREALRSLS
ncbi:MAG: regulatory protein RecX [Lachnospiraceae bacterium]|uniref:Regulatory protein RecX n=1 Tax=Candidatus Weimeria bifida TaxID=2599074 RepID=A0A6N7IX60_9FIRM|nr:regulatory protein RecX [Candidatus Weimeria bifida]RRF96119.1 MAG: regulatory protein RecX [Lachnospiraceae bacterium]